MNHRRLLDAEFLAFHRLAQDGIEAEYDENVAVSNLSQKNVEIFVADKSRHHQSTRKCQHSFNQIVRVLRRGGWEVGDVDVPTRKEVLAGCLDPGTYTMTYPTKNETTLPMIALKYRLIVPGARRPNERLSSAEWATLVVEIERAYNLLGLKAPNFNVIIPR